VGAGGLPPKTEFELAIYRSDPGEGYRRLFLTVVNSRSDANGEALITFGRAGQTNTGCYVAVLDPRISVPSGATAPDGATAEFCAGDQPT